MITSVKNLDPGRALHSAPNLSAPYSYAQVVQPVLAYEAILHPTSDLGALALHLYSLALSFNMSFAELAFQVIRCSLSTVSHKVSIHSLKLDAFLLVRLPTLLDRLASHMRAEVGPALKTPTDTYKAFDKILRDEALLDAADLRCQCNIVETLLKVVGRCSPALMTETETVDVAKRRKTQLSAAPSGRVSSEDVPEELVGSPRNFETTLKAEAMMNSVLDVMGQDSSKVESIENLLGVLCLMISGESFDRLLAASSANGRLKPFVRAMVKFNQQSQESQGESVKNSLLRAALFDITFLMLVHVANGFGRETVLQEAKDTLIETWYPTDIGITT